MIAIISNIIGALDGKKSYITAAAGILVAVGIKMNYLTAQDAATIGAGLASLYGIFLRMAVKKDRGCGNEIVP